MEITIHRGSSEIGGTCIQLSTKSTTILLDMGLPLSKESKEIDLAGIDIDAVLVSHPHQDHYGLIEKIDNNVPVYIGEVGKDLIDATRMLLRKDLHDNNFKYFKRDGILHIGDFTIKPYLVDHSSVDAYAFLIEAEGKRIFYSGDFRAHGRKSKLFDEFIENPPENIDLLFMEGTMIERVNDEFPTEKTVGAKIKETIKNQENISFLISSSQNIDRLCSAYGACLQTGTTLVIDIYTAWVLEKIKKISIKVPAMGKDNVSVYTDYQQDEILKANQDFFGDFRKRVYNHRVKKEKMEAEPSKYLYLSKMSKFRIIDRYKKNKLVNVIYSQWLGYLKCSNKAYFGAEEMSKYQNDPQVNFVYAHTSGHATEKDLQAFDKAINPKTLIPIHTEYGEKYQELFDNVRIVRDNEPFII